MIKFIRNWYRTKKIQAELKAELYNGIIMIVREHSDIKELLTNTYNVDQNQQDIQTSRKRVKAVRYRILSGGTQIWQRRK